VLLPALKAFVQQGFTEYSLMLQQMVNKTMTELETLPSAEATPHNDIEMEFAFNLMNNGVRPDRHCSIWGTITPLQGPGISQTSHASSIVTEDIASLNLLLIKQRRKDLAGAREVFKYVNPNFNP